MKTVEQSIIVRTPVNVAYDQWTRFEDFPYIMRGVTKVCQEDDSRLTWEAVMGGMKVSWATEIFEQVPDECIAWRGTQGIAHWGKVRFAPLSAQSCRVTVVIHHTPRGFLQHLASWLGLIQNALNLNLKLFKEFTESRGMKPRGWRGEIHRQTLAPLNPSLRLHTQPESAMLQPSFTFAQ